MENRYAKVLVLCENSPYSVNGGGVLLSNLFQEFPPENLFFFHRNFNQPGKPVGYRERRLLWNWVRVDVVTFTKNMLRWLLFAVKDPRNTRVSDIPAIYLQSSRFRFPAAIDKEVRSFAPDIIYAWTASLIWANTLRAVAKRYNLPYVIHFMDNHVEVKPSTPLEKVLQDKLSETLLPVVGNAAAILSISEAMSAAYREKWGIASKVFHGSIDISKWPLPAQRQPNDEFTLLYNGSVDRGQLLGLMDVAEAVESLSATGVGIRLVVLVAEGYSAVVSAAMARFKSVAIEIQPGFSDLRERLAKADLLVIAYGFDDKTISYFRYSFATKVVPYMLSGQCILAYGPPEIEPIDYVKRGKWGITVTERNIHTLAATIEQLYHQPEKRRQLAELAWNVASAEHDSKTNGIRFAEYLSSLAN